MPVPRLLQLHLCDLRTQPPRGTQQVPSRCFVDKGCRNACPERPRALRGSLVISGLQSPRYSALLEDRVGSETEGRWLGLHRAARALHTPSWVAPDGQPLGGELPREFPVQLRKSSGKISGFEGAAASPVRLPHTHNSASLAFLTFQEPRGGLTVSRAAQCFCCCAGPWRFHAHTQACYRALPGPLDAVRWGRRDRKGRWGTCFGFSLILTSSRCLR